MNELLARLCSETDSVRCLWLGNDNWLLWDGQHMIGFDLDPCNFRRMCPCPVSAEEIAPYLDLLLITHEHEDHFNADTCCALVAHAHCRFAVPLSCNNKAAEIGLPAERRFSTVPGMHFSAAGADFMCTRAIHGHIGGTVYSAAATHDCGYRFTFGGLDFYQPGDTLLLEEHLTMPPVDVLFVSPTEHNTWIDNSVRLISLLQPKQIFFQHFGTYNETPANRFWSHGYVDEVIARLPPEAQARCTVPILGNIFQLSTTNHATDIRSIL